MAKTYKEFILEANMTTKEAEIILGLSSGYTSDDVKKAYAAKAKINHPDKGGSTDMMQKINVAYGILKGKIVSVGGNAKPSNDSVRNNIRTEYEMLHDIIIADLRAKVRPSIYVNHFEKIFDDKFTANIIESEKGNNYSGPHTANIRMEIKNGDNTRVFDINFSVKLVDIYHSQGIGHGNIQYQMTIFTKGYADGKKLKASSRDFEWTNNHAVFTDPNMVFDSKKLATKVKSTTTKKIKPADLRLFFEKQMSAIKGQNIDSYFVELKDGVYANFSRQVLLRTGVWYFRGFYIKNQKNWLNQHPTNKTNYIYLSEDDNIMDIVQQLVKFDMNGANRMLQSIDLQNKAKYK
jgi:hypothetical protein